MNTTATTTYIRSSEQTMRSQASRAYSQCLPEPNYGYRPGPNYGYSPEPNYGYYNEQVQMPQQPMPVQAPGARSSSAGKGLLFVAGLAVVGAASFAGVMLLNSSDSQPTETAATSSPGVSDPAGSTIVNLPSAVDIPSLAPAQNAPAPVIVNNPAPIRVSGGPVSAPRSVATPKPITAPKPIAAPAPAPAPAPKPGPGVNIKAPGVEVGVPSQGGVSVKTPGVEVGVPGQNGGDVVVAVPGTQAPAKTGGTTPPPAGGGATNPPAGGTTTPPAGGGGTTTPPAGTEGTKPAGGAGTTAEGTTPPAGTEGTKPAGGAGTTAEGTKPATEQKAGDVFADAADAIADATATAGQ